MLWFKKKKKKQQSTVQYQLQSWNIARADPQRAETEDYWKSIWEKQSSHTTDAQWVTDLKAAYYILPEQEPVTIKAADIQQQVHEQLNSMRACFL